MKCVERQKNQGRNVFRNLIIQPCLDVRQMKMHVHELGQNKELIAYKFH